MTHQKNLCRILFFGPNMSQVRIRHLVRLVVEPYLENIIKTPKKDGTLQF